MVLCRGVENRVQKEQLVGWGEEEVGWFAKHHFDNGAPPRPVRVNCMSFGGIDGALFGGMGRHIGCAAGKCQMRQR